jgi:hypothetical protein
LPRGHRWQHVVGEVRGHLAHPPGVAGGADASALQASGGFSLNASVRIHGSASCERLLR